MIVSDAAFGRMALSRMTVGLMIFGRMTRSRRTRKKMTFARMTLKSGMKLVDCILAE